MRGTAEVARSLPNTAVSGPERAVERSRVPHARCAARPSSSTYWSASTATQTFVEFAEGEARRSLGIARISRRGGACRPKGFFTNSLGPS
jgi:hypothetical protein